MLLRASGEATGQGVDARAVTDDAVAESSGIPHAALLLAFADAVVGDDDRAMTSAREAVRSALGDAQLVDTAAVAANFQRMVRIADATGIPLDGPSDVFTRDLRADLGIDAYGSAANTPPPGILKRAFGTVAGPLRVPLMKLALGGMRRRRARGLGNQPGGSR